MTIFSGGTGILDRVTRRQVRGELGLGRRFGSLERRSWDRVLWCGLCCEAIGRRFGLPLLLKLGAI